MQFRLRCTSLQQQTESLRSQTGSMYFESWPSTRLAGFSKVYQAVAIGEEELGFLSLLVKPRTQASLAYKK